MAVEAKTPAVASVATKKASTTVAKANSMKFNAFMKSPNVLASIEGTLGSSAKTKTFVASIISAVSTNQQLAKCDNASIVSAALLGESLNLSPSPQLGQYYMVPFDDRKNGRTVATFILGWKGYYQLAMRSGAYKKLHAIEIKEGELKKYDPINETYEFETIADPAEIKKAKTIGYYAFFETINGFKKAKYWTIEEMQAHALEYSKGYASDVKNGTKYTFWSKQFDEMAIKTCFRNLISRYGVMSVELQKAFLHDTSYTEDLPNEDGTEAEPIYFDNANTVDVEAEEVTNA